MSWRHDKNFEWKSTNTSGECCGNCCEWTGQIKVGSTTFCSACQAHGGFNDTGAGVSQDSWCKDWFKRPDDWPIPGLSLNIKGA